MVKEKNNWGKLFYKKQPHKMCYIVTVFGLSYRDTYIYNKLIIYKIKYKIKYHKTSCKNKNIHIYCLFLMWCINFIITMTECTWKYNYYLFLYRKCLQWMASFNKILITIIGNCKFYHIFLLCLGIAILKQIAYYFKNKK